MKKISNLKREFRQLLNTKICDTYMSQIMKYKKVFVYSDSSHLRNRLTPICQSCFDKEMHIKVKGSAYVRQHNRKDIIYS